MINSRTSYNVSKDYFNSLTPFYKHDSFHAYSEFTKELLAICSKLFAETFYYDEPVTNFKNCLEELNEEYEVFLRKYNKYLILTYDFKNEKISSICLKIPYEQYYADKESNKEEITVSLWDEVFDELDCYNKLKELKIDTSIIISNAEIIVNPEYRGKGITGYQNDLAFNFHPIISKMNFTYVIYESMNIASDKASLTSGGIEISKIVYKDFKLKDGTYPFEGFESFLKEKYPHFIGSTFMRSYLSKISDIKYKSKLL